MKLNKTKHGRNIKFQFHLSDFSGHGDILDMLASMEESQAEIGAAALRLLAMNKGYLKHKPDANEITQEMIELVQEMRQRQQQLSEMQALVIDLLKNASFAPGVQAEFEKRFGDIQQMTVIEGAGNYGGELYENTGDDGFGDWGQE